MARTVSLLLCIISIITHVCAVPLSTSPNPAIVAHNALSKRGEPTTGDDDFEDTEPHPNLLDQVETAFIDAMWLAGLALVSIDEDTEVFSHYFNEADRAGVKNVFLAVKGITTDPEDPSMGDDRLSNIHVQRTDPKGLCADGRTLAYTQDGETDKPAIVICDRAFKKKAVFRLKGTDPFEDANEKWYMTCGQLNGHVSYLMNILGATFLHEYLHFDGLVQSVFGAPIIDQADANEVSIGYGPVQVYDNLSKDLAPFNADSYTYYALNIFWNFLCSTTFEAPRAGIDDADPDCGGETCID